LQADEGSKDDVGSEALDEFGELIDIWKAEHSGKKDPTPVTSGTFKYNRH